MAAPASAGGRNVPLNPNILNSHSGLGHGAGSMYGAGADTTSRPGSGHGSSLNSNALFRGN